jgi:hypothetical protein
MVTWGELILPIDEKKFTILIYVNGLFQFLSFFKLTLVSQKALGVANKGQQFFKPWECCFMHHVEKLCGGVNERDVHVTGMSLYCTSPH